MKKVLLFLLLTPFIFSSCSKEETALTPVDDYVGTWNETSTGSMDMLYNSVSAGSFPTDQSSTSIKITKISTNQLSIDDMVVSVSGTSISIPTKTQTETQDGITMTLTAKYSGTVSKNLITIKETYSGSWSMGTAGSGAISGSTTYTFTR